ncbi:hypothetical protein EDC04DRAFT_2556465 [Pisolithus marmoratus]|nr:hypothetical protein EDC04DRAFT_2556465 [Pisolithus marmoratus]
MPSIVGHHRIAASADSLHATTFGAEAIHSDPRDPSEFLTAASRSSLHSDTASRDTDTDTDAVLSYYRTTPDVATTTRAGTQPRHNSNTSTSTYSSDYSVASAADSLTTSTDIPAVQPCVEQPPAVSARRRTSIPTQGGNDRRRLAIVEHAANDQNSNHKQSSDSNGLRTYAARSVNSLALVAPPDASPRSYSALPSCRASLPRDGQCVPSSRSHTRSSSEAVKASSRAMGHVARKSSREVAIVGTAASFPEGTASDLQQWSKLSPHLDALKPPLFQVPQSRSPSPGTSEVSDSSSSAYRARQRKDAITLGVSPIKELKEGSTPVVTPSIGESKHISDRVAAPIVINLFPESPSPSPRSISQHSTSQQSTSSSVIFSDPFSPSTAQTSPTAEMSPYLHYQPGIHATAGPLPPPPMVVSSINPTTPPPPRPPRQYPIRRKGDTEAIREALQLPSHVTAALKAKSSSPVSSYKSGLTEFHGSPLSSVKELPSYKNVEVASIAESTDSLPKPIHTREGAFPPSRLCTVDVEKSATRLETDIGIITSDDVPPPTVIEPPRNHEGHSGRQGLDLRGKEQTKFSFGAEALQADHSPSPQSEESASRSSLLDKVLPPVPAMENDSYIDTKIKNMVHKRFSTLPRTPSLISLNRHSTTSKQSFNSPSLSVNRPTLLERPPVRRIRSASPSAMHFSDVLAKRTALERSIGYARKVNELYHYDCGLGDWMAEVRHRATRPQSIGKRHPVLNNEEPLVPSTFAPPVERRHVSQSSTDSGVTFPRRPDAYSATDLASRAAGDNSPPNAPPPLPYPALAAAPRNGPSRASTIVATSSSSSSSMKSPGGFFSALGRKTSLKREHGFNTPSSPVRNLLTKSPPKVEPNPRPANAAPVTPSIPGGPRAPPNRMQRSQTVIVAPQPPQNSKTPQRSSTAARRPSLFGGGGSNPEKQSNALSEVEFNRQLDRLTVLLPRANKSVLATYLRHTGQDMLALGQYIEDDKNGTYRYDST